ncbi:MULTISPECIES: MBOAT family O-acyltransferase [Rhodomicrobium]|uniref:MBOAT family O-acyltransferase n=1 Tax=Rhodomicrobium TaxID=1068 RepID=UPI000B4B1481|nr:MULTISPECIES: MBOAT family O-acyltransferase [Rhodomicrobium]
MPFSDQSFLFVFLPVVLLLGLPLAGTRHFLGFLFASSLFFYFWSSGYHVLVLLLSIGFNYAGALSLEREPSRAKLTLLIAGNVGLLVFYKYIGFLLTQLGVPVAGGLGGWFHDLVLPLGISFFCFQGISYLIDVYRGSVPAEHDFVRYGAYKSFFPQLIAGPIVRYTDVAADLLSPQRSLDLFSAGAARFSHGLIKKLLIADGVAGLADAAFSVPNAELNCLTAVVGSVAFALQIYFDFSGYSDMAIGLAMMLGVRFPENFARPYSSATITEFWRRWHISLSSWFRDYVYKPLGGNRRGPVLTYCNLLIVFLLTGLWHGAAWTFLLWGLYHGLFLILERLALGEKAKAMPQGWLRYVYALPVVLVGWILFRAADLGQAGAFLAAMASPFAANSFDVLPAVRAAMSPQVLVIFLGAMAIFVMPRAPSHAAWLFRSTDRPLMAATRMAYMSACFTVAATIAFSQSYSPFLYWRF